jgi:radical SAM protein (TIGR04043 family)
MGASTTAAPNGLDARAAVAVLGVRVAPPVRRPAGAGPSDDGHLRIGGRGAAVPLDPSSPFELAGGRLLYDGADVGLPAEPLARPRFYDLRTADGVPYEQLARLHGEGVLATTVIQTCIRYEPDQRCRFCAIEEPLASGATTRVKTPAQLAEVAEAAVRLDGVHQMVMTTGTTATPDRGARYLARCVSAVRRAVPGLAVQVQCEPPADPSALAVLREAGATAIGIHVESLDEGVRRRWMPGKAAVPLPVYWDAWTTAVGLFGRNRVSTYLLVGLGEDPDDLVAGAQRLIDLGVYPFVVPFRPLTGTLAAGEPAPDPAVLTEVTRRVGAALAAAGMRGADQEAGCAACGACSALADAGG